VLPPNPLSAGLHFDWVLAIQFCFVSQVFSLVFNELFRKNKWEKSVQFQVCSPKFGCETGVFHQFSTSPRLQVATRCHNNTQDTHSTSHIYYCNWSHHVPQQLSLHPRNSPNSAIITVQVLLLSPLWSYLHLLERQDAILIIWVLYTSRWVHLSLTGLQVFPKRLISTVLIWLCPAFFIGRQLDVLNLNVSVAHGRVKLEKADNDSSSLGPQVF
jgi:hypothetical protein